MAQKNFNKSSSRINNCDDNERNEFEDCNDNEPSTTTDDTQSLDDYSFFSRLKVLFNSTDLYEVLQIENRKCSPQDVRKAYLKMSLRVHPDRVGPDSTDITRATEQFQLLRRVYDVLKVNERRNLYDKHGIVDTEDHLEPPNGAQSWDEYWKIMYPKILQKDIDEFFQKYKGSDEELSDLKEAYITNKGDMDLIIESVQCCAYDDDVRFREILNPLIAVGELPVYKDFQTESKKKRMARKRRGEKEAKEAEDLKKELGIEIKDDESSLIAAIKGKSSHAKFDCMIAKLEDKYVNNNIKGSKKSVNCNLNSKNKNTNNKRKI